MKGRFSLSLTMVLVLCLSVGLIFAQGQSEVKPEELTILLSDDKLEGGAFHILAQMYEQEKGIKVNVIEIPYADMATKLGNMIRAKNAPNIVRTTGITGFEDQMLDLSKVIDKNIILKARLNNCLYNGKLYAIPSNVTANGMLYNKDAFAQAGVKVPTSEADLWSWDEFIVAIEKVVKHSDAEIGMVWDRSQHRYATMLYQFGGSFFSEDLEYVRIANDKSVKSLETFLSLFEKGLMPKSVWVGTEDPSAMFKTGKVAVHMSGNWKIPDYTANIKDFNWGVLLMPYAEQRSSVLGGNYVHGMEGTGKEKETLEFLKWFYSDEIYTKYCEIGKYLPGRENISPAYDVQGLSVFVQELAATPAIAGSDWSTSSKYPGLSWGNALRDNIELAIVGKLSPQAALIATEKIIMDTFKGIKSER